MLFYTAISVFFILLGLLISSLLISFFSTILPFKRNLLTYLDSLLVLSLETAVIGQVPP